MFSRNGIFQTLRRLGSVVIDFLLSLLLLMVEFDFISGKMASPKETG